MQHEIQYSIKRHLETAIGVPVVWVYDGVALPTVKPFITIEQMQNNNEILTKRREAIETIFRFQVGLYTNNTTERARKQAEVVNAINFETITLYQTSQSPATAVGFFDAFVTSVVPMPAESTDAKTQFHKVYFDVEVTQIYGRN
jgi:ABC-type polysaccharide transport system permease subunit